MPILDDLLSKIDKRFSSHQKTAFQGLYLVRSVLVMKYLATVSNQVVKVEGFNEVDLSNVAALKSETHS